MALIFTEGFDSYGSISSNPEDHIARKWPNTTGSSTSAFALLAGRVEGRAFTPNQNRWIQTPSLGNLADLLVGVAFNPQSMVTDSEQRIVSLYEGANLGINVRLTSAGELAVYKNTSHLQTTSGLGLTTAQWKTIELHVHAHASTGTYTLKLNGSTVLSDTNVNTVANSNAYYNAVRLGPTGSAVAHCAYDDVYIRDDSTFLLDWRISTRFPTSDVAVAGTPSSGSDNFAMVDDATPDGDSTYVDSNTADVDLYGFGAVDGGLVHAVVVNAFCRESDANPFDITLLAKSGITTGSGAQQAIGSTSFVLRSEVFDVNPDTLAAWTPSEINAAQFGFEIQ